MKTNNIYTAYVSWGPDGERRPVLVVKDRQERVYCYKITSQYRNKSDQIKQNYFPLNDWRHEGLKVQSYVDIGCMVPLDKKRTRFYYVGELTLNDTRQLIEFIRNRYSLQH